jgi:acetyl-CoA C-acetyltransferase
MCDEQTAKKHKTKIDLIGAGVGSDLIAVNEREDITVFNSLKHAAKTALAQAKITPEDISFAELCDSFSISEIMSMEDIGFCKKGKAGEFIEKGNANLDGKLPINTSGGLKGCSHPLAATGIRQAIECFYQLNNIASRRQIKNAKYGLASTISGTGASAVVSIFSK